MTAFLRGFAIAAVATGLVIAVVGLATSRILFSEPQARYEARGFSYLVPAGWHCREAGTESVCRPDEPEAARRAVIVATAKTIGENDNTDFFRTYLSAPKTPAPRNGAESPPSKVLYVRAVSLNGREWLDSTHQGALLPRFTSRYLATVDGATSLLVTLSFREEIFEEQAELIEAFASSILIR